MSLINVKQINIIDATTDTALEGSVIIAAQSDENLWSSNTEGAILVPRGDATDRDTIITSPTAGYIRYNTTLNEFEVYTQSGWRPIGQYTQDGTVSLPSRSFISAQDTGSYLNSGNYAITVDAILQLDISSTEVNVVNDLVVDGEITLNDTLFIGDPLSETIEYLTPTSTTLTGGATNTNLPDPLTFDGTEYGSMIVDYSVSRSGVGVQTGTLMVATDGTTASLINTNTAIGSIGVSFNTTVVTNTVSIRYTLTAGVDATMKFAARRWSL